MSSNRVEQLQAEVSYYRDRTSLLRAKLYRGGLGTSARLEELERELARAEQRLRTERVRARDEVRRGQGTSPRIRSDGDAATQSVCSPQSSAPAPRSKPVTHAPRLVAQMRRWWHTSFR